MKKLITTLCLKLLNWTGYTIPLPHPIPIKPTIISPEISKRARAEEKINFYQLYPLYQEELEFKLENSLDDLCEKIDEKDLDFVVNINRKNYCK